MSVLISTTAGSYATRFGYEYTPVPKLMSRVLGSPEEHQLPGRTNHYFKERENNVPAMAENSIPLSQQTIPEHMKGAGYHNILIGKWVR